MEYSVPRRGWPKGVDNIHASHELPQDVLRDAVNVDIFESGKLRRRRGSTLQTALVGAHSLWSDPNVLEAYYVAGTTMYSLSQALASVAVVTGLMPGAKVSYLQLNGEVFWSNGVTSGRIVGGVNAPWGVETPAGNATLAATTGGLIAGTYQIVTTFRNAAGEESGAQNAQAITLTATGGISITNLPAAISATITHQNIYATLANGDVLYKIATLPIATTTFSLVSMPTQTVALKTQDLAAMLAGTILAYHNGQIFVASGRFVYYSEPLRYGLYNPTKNFYMYPEDVTVMLATQDGLHICADKTYFVSGAGTDDAAQVVKFPYGGIRGTGVYLPEDTGVAWFSPRGQMRAVGSEVVSLIEKQFVPGIMSSGNAFVREQQGLKQIITVVQQSGDSPLKYTGV